MMYRLLAILLATAAPAASTEPDPPGPAAAEYAARRGKVLELLAKGKSGAILLRSPAAARFAGDVDYPYRPDNDLLYLAGIPQEGAALLLAGDEIAGLGREVLFLPPAGHGEGIWIAKRLTAKEAGAASGIPERAILSTEKLAETLRKALPRESFHHRGPEAPPPPLYYDGGGRSRPGEPLPGGYALLVSWLGSGAFHLDLRRPGPLIAGLREEKSASEVALLRRAISITCAAHRRVLREIRPGAYEYQVAALIEHEFRTRGASGWAFPSIVGSGPNSCILHYDRYDRQTAAGDLVVMDIGAEYGFYAADVTRTVPVSGRFTERQRRVYQIVLEAQEAAIRIIRPGLPHGDINRRAQEVVAEGLIKLGLIREKSEVGKYLPHGVSHGLGLDVHDALVSSTLRPGMVITVEPGIYIAEEALGVRIEDDVLVTPDGYEVLSTSAPRTVEEIERWMGAESL